MMKQPNETVRGVSSVLITNLYAHAGNSNSASCLRGQPCTTD